MTVLVMIGDSPRDNEWLDKTKVILNSTQFKLKLKLELSLAIKGEFLRFFSHPVC